MTDAIDKPYQEQADPSGQQQGLDAPGPMASFADLLNYGVFNGNFRVGPPDPSANVDLATSTAGSNFVPGWRFIQSSNTSVTLTHIRNVNAPAGSNLRFTFTGAVSGDTAYVEQLIDIGGSRSQWTSNTIRAHAENSNANANLQVRAQYLTTDGSIVGMPPEISSGTLNVAPMRALLDAETDTAPAPPNARYLRVRVEARSTGSFSGLLDLYEVRRERGASVLRLSDPYDPASTAPTAIFTQANDLYSAVNTTGDPVSTGSRRLLSRQLIAIPFVLLNVPANATTEMQLSDVALGLTTPRIGMITGGSIVGISYRLSTGITGPVGSPNALRIRATVAGASVWVAHTLTTASAVTGEATQAIGTDDFTAGQQLGIDVLTVTGFTPTSLDMACLLWVALRYTGG